MRDLTSLLLSGRLGGEPWTRVRDLAIRPASRRELDLAVEWAAKEGWNPGLSDAACFYVADPEGFLLAFRDGEPVASISVVRYGGAFGFLGLYIVRPDLRGRGYGYRLWQAGMAHLGERTVGLDGVVAQQADSSPLRLQLGAPKHSLRRSASHQRASGRPDQAC